MNLRDEVEKIKTEGYSEANAESKLCQDIVLKAIAESGMARNATIKGGVVMRSLSKNARRATQDIDLDFIRYSISDESIRQFVKRLDCIEGLSISIDGKITELKHQDYKGKRITITIKDSNDTVLSLKMDIGVHVDLSLEQEDAVSLLIDSKAQMITEKLKSLVRFASRSTRYKDVFDICYLSDEVDKEQLRDCIDKYIISDETLRNVETMADVVKRVERVFSNKAYIDAVSKSDKNWLDMPVEAVLKKDLEFIKSL